MDIEALRKLNELTKALQQHGMSISSQDAMTQAEQILHPIQEKTRAEPIQTENQTTEYTDRLMERKYKLLLEMNNKKFEETITTLKNSIHTLTQDMAKLKTDLTLMEMKKTLIQEQSTPITTTTKIEQQQEQTDTQPQQKKETHPRQGNFNPGDISIEKVFYFGHK